MKIIESICEQEIFTAEHRAFRASVARFVTERCDPFAEEWNAAGRIPRELWREMGELGFLGCHYDASLGGSGGDIMFPVILGEELARSRVRGLSAMVTDHTDMSSNYILSGSRFLQEKYITKCITGEFICGVAMTEPGGGSDLAAMRTRAVRDGESYVINGEKTFITNGSTGDIIVVAARTNPNAAKPHEGISLFVVEAGTPGFTAGKPFKKMGNHASDTAPLFFSDCRVPAENRIGEEGEGFKILMKNLAIERLIGTGVYLTACEEMLKITMEYTKGRKIFGKPIAAFQVNSHKLVDLYTRWAMTRAFFHQVCLRHMRGDASVEEIAMMKYISSDLSNETAYHCVQMHGGWGYMDEYRISQWYTDVRLYNIAAGATEVMKDIIAKRLGLV